MKVFENDITVGKKLEHFENQTEERGGFLLAIGSTKVRHLNGAIAESGLINGKALFFPVIRLGYTVTDRLLEKIGRINIMNRLTRVAALVKHAFCIDVMGHHK